MDYLSIFFLWLVFATFLAGITQIIALLHGAKFDKKQTSIHWVHWVVFPVFLFVLIGATFFYIIRTYAKAQKVIEIKKMWVVFGKNLLGDWSV